MMGLILGIPIPSLLAIMEVGIVNSEGKMASDYLKEYKIVNAKNHKNNDELKDNKKENNFEIFKNEL